MPPILPVSQQFDQQTLVKIIQADALVALSGLLRPGRVGRLRLAYPSRQTGTPASSDERLSQSLPHQSHRTEALHATAARLSARASPAHARTGLSSRPGCHPTLRL